MFGTVVVGTDGADKGRNAVRLACLLAGITGDRLVLVTVRLDPAIDLSQHVADAARFGRELEERLSRVRDELAPDATVHVQAGISVAHGLRIVVDRDRAGLVVVGAAQRQGRARLVEGDHAMQVMNGAPCAVLLVPEEHDEPPAIGNIVVGLDSTPEAAAACRLGAELARRCGASLRLIKALDDPPGLGVGPYGIDWGDVLAERTAQGERMVEAAAARSGVAGAEGHVARGGVVDALLGASAEADLLVLGSRRWGPIRRLVLGSTTSSVLREAQCPVLIPPRTDTAGADAAMTEEAPAQ
jgi:nucleotide-binding universal stress UspA family protein